MTQPIAKHYDSKTVNSNLLVVLEAANWWDGVKDCQGQSSGMHKISTDLSASVFPKGFIIST